MLCIAIVCAALSVCLGVKVVLMRESAAQIREGFEEKLKGDTNTLLSISSRDSKMRRLASGINAQLRELRRERRRFTQGDLELKNAVTNISHDIRTPLAAICAYLDLLESCEKSGEAERYLAIIRDRTELLRQLTEELFRYSVVTAPDRSVLVEEVVVNGVLEESIAGFYAALREKNIEPNVHMTEKRVVRKLNPASLSRVFANLMQNAVKYSGGDLDIGLTEEGEIIFSNTAPELDEVQVGKLFDRFYTVEASRKSTGLGLAIAKTLVEQMGGAIAAGYEGGKLWIRVWLGEK